MITEIAQIDVKPGHEKEFEAAIAKAEPIFKRCKGWKSFELHRGIENHSATGCTSNGRRWKITRWIFAARKISPNGARWSARISPPRPRSSIPIR